MSLNLHLRCGKKVFDLFQTPTEVSVKARNTHSYYETYVDYCFENDLGGLGHIAALDKFIEANPLHEWSVW